MPAPRRPWLVTILAAALAAALAVPAAAGPPVPPGQPVPSGAEVSWDATTCAATVDVVVSKAGPRVTEVVVDHNGLSETWTAESRWLNGSTRQMVLEPGDGFEHTVTVTMHERRGRVVSEFVYRCEVLRRPT